ncbi:hypothetical protein AKJ16_DCAP26251 [Drosera capensis]
MSSLTSLTFMSTFFTNSSILLSYLPNKFEFRLGLGIPGLSFGVGVGAGCGVGIGFGYGAGRGIAYDEKQQYSNVGKLFQRQESITSRDRDVVVALFDELVDHTTKLIETASKEINKWRR